MASTSYAGLLLNVMFLLLAVQYSTADVDHEGNGSMMEYWLRGVTSLTRDHAPFHSDNGLDTNGRNLVGGRKMLQEVLGEKTKIISENNKPAAKGHGQDHSDDHSVKWLEAADELAGLMRRDYGRRPKGKRNSPIHNGEPKH